MISPLGSEFFGARSPCLIHDDKCTCPPLKTSGGIKIYKRTELMQRAQKPPSFVTSRQSHTDAETGVVYDPEQPIPYAVAARLGIVPPLERSEDPGPNTARKPQANRMAKKGGDR